MKRLNQELCDMIDGSFLLYIRQFSKKIKSLPNKDSLKRMSYKIHYLINQVNI